MKYEIIASGSTGNALILNDVVMIDCGVSFKKLIPYYLNLQVVLLTHIHSDHFSKATIKRLAAERPTLRWGCPEWLVAPLVKCGVRKTQIDVMEMAAMSYYEDMATGIVPFSLEHDVSNCGYFLVFGWINKKTVAYATDTRSLPDVYYLKNLDFYFIEANYKDEEELAARMQAKIENGEHIYEKRVAENHLSEKHVLDWLIRNGRPDSLHVFLHEHQERG